MDEAHDALYEEINSLLDEQDFEKATSALSSAPENDEYEVLRIKLGLFAGSIPPGAAMQKLIQLMRQKPDLPGAKAVYQQASRLAYSERESSVAHSHPPPPVRPNSKS